MLRVFLIFSEFFINITQYFRYKHMSIRTHAESVAFYDSAHNELLQTNKIFDDLISKLHIELHILN